MMLDLHDTLQRAAQFMDQTKSGGGIFGAGDEELRASITAHLRLLRRRMDTNDGE